MAEMSINERIAKVKGWRREKGEEAGHTFEGWRCGDRWTWELPNWQHNIADAWELVEEARATGLDAFELHSGVEGDEPQYWLAHFGGVDRAEQGTAPTAPEAIALAYLAIHER